MAEKKEEESTVTMEKVNEAIENALQPIKELLTNSNPSGTDDKKEEGDTRRTRTTERNTSRRSIRDIERDAEELVQREVAKVFTEKEHEAEHRRLERQRTRKEPEKPPFKARKLTELMLGKRFIEDHTK